LRSRRAFLKVELIGCDMEICKSQNCNNETEWIDEPEEFCAQCVCLMTDDYHLYIKEINQQISNDFGLSKELLGK
jgi:hypothetical protein